MSPRIAPSILRMFGLLAVALAVVPSAARAAVPAATAVPTVTGQYRVGQLLTATNGTWSPSSGLTYVQAWERCDEDGATCTAISGISGTKYTLQAADLGATVRVKVSATNVDGTGVARSGVTPVITAKEPPVNDEPPVLSGAPLEGQSLTVDDGTWSGPGPPKITRAWQRCQSDGVTCTAISGATGATYKLVPADIGSRIRVDVIGTSSDGVTHAYTAATAAVAGVAPANTVAPTLTGTTRDGQVLHIATNGTWTGTLPQTATFRWERCSAAGEPPCDVIAGQATKDYQLTADDVDRTVRGVVTMTNVAGATSATTAVSAKIGPKVPPANTAGPAIAGAPVDGQTLTAADGTWTGTASITTTRVWQRCNALGLSCLDTATTATTFKLASTDVGSTFRIRVTAKNPDGQTSITSDATAAVGPALPAVTTAPVVSGTLKEGQLLTTTAGKWSGTPDITYAYGWQRCLSGTCSDIASATGATYRLTADDVGATMKSVVTASNAAGIATPAVSAATATVTAGPPVSTALPEISGALARDGQAWSSAVGTWAGTGPQTYERQWLRCTSAGSGCVVISGAVGTTYALTAADVGKTVRVEITALSAQGATKAQSAPSPVIVAARPELDGTVTVDGTLRDGQTLTATSAWTGTAPIALTHRWQRCVVTCVDITGATAQTYKLTPADVGARVKVLVGATNGGGGGAGESAETATVLPDPPAAAAVPALAGAAREGEALSVGTGTFTGTTPLTYTYAWERCSNVGDGCAPIAGATAATYVLGAADRGQTVRATVTATNDAGTASATTALSAIVALAPPANTIVPAVTPNSGLRDGVLLTSTSGAWSGSAPMDIAYRWERCNLAGTTCEAIAGAGDPTYRASTADVGFTLRAVVTATNGAGSASKPSLVTGVVGTNPPANDAIPVVTVDGGGAAIDGATLRTTEGAWHGLVPMTPSYEWWRCDPDGESCSPIPQATASSYTLTPDDVGLTLRARVTQTNAGGSQAALSAATAVVVAAPPVSRVRPQITGAAAVGKTLTASPGVWTGTPELRYAYRWERCQLDGTGCVAIAGAEASTYVLTDADNDLTVRVVVTATNDVGTDEAASLTTAEVQDEPPVKLTGPSIVAAGLVAQGATLEVDPGTWGGAQPVALTNQWRRCDVALTGCTDIPSATGTTYQLTRDDVGKRLVVVVTATNVVDVATAQTDATPTVLPEPPANTVLPTIGATGGVRDGAKLTATNGNWNGAAPMTFAVIWLRCDADGAGCLPASEVPSATYTLTSDDVGSRMRVRVTATNPATSATVESNATAVVTAASPAATLRPSVLALDGKAQVGGRLRGVAGTWSGTNPMTMAYQWQRCAASSTAACDDVAGATGTEYVMTTTDVGKRLRLVVTATNAGGTVTAESTPSDVVPAIPPDSASAPTISGGPFREGVTITGDPGTWTGSEPMTLGYQWEKCKEAGSTSCAKISGATQRTYTLAATDVGAYVRLSVTAVNAGGKATRSSVPVGAVDGVAPVNTGLPAVSVKGVKVGGTLTATTGKWTGTATIKYTTRWQRCNAAGTSCADLDGGTAATYKLTAEDVNGTLLAAPMRAVVTATNVAGSADAASAIIGTARDGLGVGAAGDDATAAAAKKTAKKKTGTAVAVPAKLRGLKALARVKKLTLSSKGRLTLTFHCAKNAKTKCGAIGALSYRTLALTIEAGPVKKGKTSKITWSLTKEQRKLFKGRAKATFRVRVAAPATTTLAKVMRRAVTVPKALRGKATKKKSSKSKSKTTSRSKTATTRKTASSSRTTAARGTA